MNAINNETIEGDKVDYQKRNEELQQIYLSNRKDFQKRKELREKRLKQINEYREEQVAALKH